MPQCIQKVVRGFELILPKVTILVLCLHCLINIISLLYYDYYFVKSVFNDPLTVERFKLPSFLGFTKRFSGIVLKLECIAFVYISCLFNWSRLMYWCLEKPPGFQ